MGAQDSRIAIELWVDDKGTVKIKQFASESEASFHKVEQAGTKAATNLSAGWGKLGTVLGTYFTAQAAGDVLKMADNYSLMDSRLKLVTTSSSELAAVQQELFRISQETGTAYATNADSFSKLGMALKGVGAPAEELLAINELVNKSLTVSGASAAESSSFLLQFAQAMGSGVLQGDEFRAMMESNSYFGAQLAKALGTNIAGLRQMATEGKLTADVLRQAFPKMAAEINTSFDKMPITIGRAMTMVENSFGKVVSEANKTSNGTGNVASAVTELAATIEKNKEGLGSLFIGMAKGAEKVVAALANIGQSFAGWEAISKGKLSFFEFATMNAAELNAWLKKNNDEIGKTPLDILKNQADVQKKITAEISKSVDAQIKLSEEQTKEAEKIVAAAKKKAEDIAKSQEEMFKETGMMAEKHYAAEEQKLVEKAARWKAADGNIVDIENWLYDQIGKLEEEAEGKGEVAAAAAMNRAQGNYRVLIDQLDAAVKAGTDQTNSMQQQIKGLDGSSFTISANLDGSGFENTINVLIDKFRQLAATAAAVKNQAAAISGSAASLPATFGEITYPSQGGGDPFGLGYDSGQGKSLTTNKTSTTTIVNNFNQKQSRSDVNAIISEQKRIEARR